jgi:hypothetical protein
MIRKILFILFLITLTSAISMLIIEKVRHELAVDRCHDRGGTWNYMDQQCD